VNASIGPSLEEASFRQRLTPRGRRSTVRLPRPARMGPRRDCVADRLHPEPFAQLLQHRSNVQLHETNLRRRMRTSARGGGGGGGGGVLSQSTDAAAYVLPSRGALPENPEKPSTWAAIRYSCRAALHPRSSGMVEELLARLKARFRRQQARFSTPDIWWFHKLEQAAAARGAAEPGDAAWAACRAAARNPRRSRAQAMTSTRAQR